MRILPLGVGDAFSARYYSSAMVVEHDGARLLIDCPHPIRKMLKEAAPELDLFDLSACVLTHLHADHASGLEGLGYFSFFVQRKKMSLLTHPDVASRLWDGHLAAGMEALMRADDFTIEPRTFDDYFALTPLDTAAPVQLGPFSIECRKTIHHIPTTALRITVGSGADRRAFSYSADTAFEPALIEWLAAADLIVHETNFGVHTPYDKLAALPEALRQKMRLIHFPDSFDLASSVIAPLVQGQWLAV